MDFQDFSRNRAVFGESTAPGVVIEDEFTFTAAENRLVHRQGKRRKRCTLLSETRAGRLSGAFTFRPPYDTAANSDRERS